MGLVKGFEKEIKTVIRTKLFTDLFNKDGVDANVQDGGMGVGLFDEGGAGRDVNRRDYQNDTPLWLAAKNHHQEVATLLQKKCCDASIIFEAAEQNKEDVLEILLAYGHLKKMINNKDEEGLTALHIASKRGYLKIVTMTPLHLAAKHGHPAVIELLLDKGPKILPDKTGLNYFDHAIDNGHMVVVKMIISSDKCYIALRNAKQEKDGSIDTPMRKLIQMAKLACDRCIERQAGKSAIHVYEFLDDTYAAEGWKTTTKARDGGGKTYGKDQQLNGKAKPYTDNSYIRKQNHPLMIMQTRVIDEKLGSLRADITEVRTSVQTIATDIAEVKQRTLTLEATYEKLSEKHDDLVESVEDLEEDLKDLQTRYEDELDKLEAFSRRDNLRLFASDFVRGRFFRPPRARCLKTAS
nr:hypothetical protein BaRGS_001376 [Batillaria attramentaria]